MGRSRSACAQANRFPSARNDIESVRKQLAAGALIDGYVGRFPYTHMFPLLLAIARGHCNRYQAQYEAHGFQRVFGGLTALEFLRYLNLSAQKESTGTGKKSNLDDWKAQPKGRKNDPTWYTALHALSVAVGPGQPADRDTPAPLSSLRHCE